MNASNPLNSAWRRLHKAAYHSIRQRSPRWGYFIDNPKQAIVSSRYYARFYDVKTAQLAPPIPQLHFDHYLAPRELERPGTAYPRILMFGQCVSVEITNNFIKNGLTVDSVILGGTNIDLPRPLGDYGMIVCHPPFRRVVPDFSQARLNYSDQESFARLFEQSRSALESILEQYLTYNEQAGTLTFLLNFFVPQANLYGRLLPRNDLRNPVFFVEELNRVIADFAWNRQNVHVIDIDGIASVFGKRYIQDDVAWWLSHGGFLDDEYVHLDAGRIHKIHKTTKYYPARVGEFLDAVREEITAAFRTISQAGMVKLVITDLDDTLWRGVLADGAAESDNPLDGWPLGYAESLLYLKARGVLLGIVSKNSEEYIRSKWDELFLGKLTFDDFAFIKINWKPKSQNIAEMLDEASLLASSAVFIDDNPVERAAVTDAFPEIRTLGAHPHSVRRILLWAAETQVSTISAESATRNDLMKVQLVRKEAQGRMKHDDFIASLNVQVQSHTLTSTDHPKFGRALELINKTNQFNTTGKRWIHQECVAHFASGGSFTVFDVKDNYSNYGTTAVAVLLPGEIVQVVMSCRLIGLEVDRKIMEALLTSFRDEDLDRVTARALDTDKNLVSRDLFKQNGFTPTDSGWARDLTEELAHR